MPIPPRSCVRRPHSAALLLLLAALALPLAGSRASATPLPAERVPEPLRPWTGWVLHGHETARCPFLHGGEGARCAWPSRLTLSVDDRAGRFAQQWLVHVEGWVPVPGDDRRWPQNVRIDRAAAAVVSRDGVPSVFLRAGEHAVTGEFRWHALPESLQVPAETGLLAATLRGRPVRFPSRDDQGRLWLQKGVGDEKAEDRLELLVHRRIVDDIPLVLTTRVELNVSGKNREVLLGKALPDRFVPMALDSRLPARVEPDGRLRVQVRPGSWVIELTARHEGPVSALAPAAAGGPWAAAEVWVFEARPDLRLAAVEGVPAVDPAQTTLPDEWKRLPAYRLRAGDTMRLVEKRRGDTDPAPDRLHLRRALWLDFDGGGYTVQDEISGAMRRSWRLEMSPPTALGRVAVDGKDQFITRVPPSTLAGVEIRQGQVRVTADSRLTGGISRLPAVGWDHDFHGVDGVLHLPPGWRLFAASGVDDVPDTWVRSWSLLDLFLVLIIALAFRRLWGWGWGAVALAALVLSFPEPRAPRWVWFTVLAGEALLRVLRPGRVQSVLKGYRLAAVAALVIVTVPFLVRQVREGMYPVLEHPYEALGGERAPYAPLGRDEAKDGEEAPPVGAPASRDRLSSKLAPLESGRVEAEKAEKKRAADLRELDPRAIVQTGPGLPAWTWRSVRLQWHGPVERAQTVHLTLISPRLTLLLALLRVALLALVVARVLGPPPGRWPGLVRSQAAAGAASLLLACVLAAGAPGEARADILPSPEILNELRSRLLEKPVCFPACASIPRLELAVGPTTLRARMEVGAEAPTAVPLPGGGPHWVPEQVILDGRPARGLLRTAGGILWLEIPPGSHQVLLEGPLPDRDAVQIPLPLKPHRVEARAEGWSVEGLGEDGLADGTLQLVRARRSTAGNPPQLPSGVLPPFVRVERTLRLGLTWRAETRVVRLTPAGMPVVIEVPLLDGESVTTPGVRVAGGKAVVNMGPQTSEAEWRSVLAEQPTIRLRAPDSLPWTEVWRLDASPVWHIALAGIPRIHHHDETGAWLPEWRPWPGEAAAIDVSRPEGLPGQVLTLDRSLLVVKPGFRATDVTLTLLLRSSRGAEHAVTLPAGAQLQSVSIDGATRPIRQDGQRVTLPLVPGRQSVQLDWRQGGGIAMRFRAPQVDLGLPGVNAEVHVAVPAARWVLFAGGPRMGPAVLFWSLLVVLVLVAVGLGRVRSTPLRTRDWLLLGVGLSQVSVAAAAVVVGWLLALGWRKARGGSIEHVGAFNAGQALLALWSVVALAVLFWSIEQGLLGPPEMQITGNGSSRLLLRWFQDRTGEGLPRPWVLSVPLPVYRAAMLAWALWLAVALLAWLRWGWACFTEAGIWRRGGLVTPAAG